MYYKGRDGISKQKDSTLNSYTVLINDYRHLSSKYFFPNIFTPFKYIYEAIVIL